MSSNNADAASDDKANAVNGENKEKENQTEETQTDGQNELSDDRRGFLLDYFSKALGISTAPKPEELLDEVSFEGVARYIASDKCCKIVTMTGAGISTSAGIPDFRSPGTGLYDNLKKYNLSEPTEAFSIDYFKENPEPFYFIRKELFGKNYKPTPAHYFIKLLEKKKKLLTHFTQNIDGLERKTDLDPDKLVEAHGTVSTGHCMECNHQYNQKWISDRVSDESAESPVPRCSQPDCNGVVRPDIVMFGERLPDRFVEKVKDIDNCDCLIIMGTSLVVQPFSSLTSRTKDNVPRLYMNMEKTGAESVHPLTALMFGGGFDFDKEDNIRDVFRQGPCDDSCYAMADLLGWGDELRKMVKDGHAKLDKQYGTSGISKPSASGSSKPCSSTTAKYPLQTARKPGMSQTGQGGLKSSAQGHGVGKSSAQGQGVGKSSAQCHGVGKSSTQGQGVGKLSAQQGQGVGKSSVSAKGSTGIGASKKVSDVRKPTSAATRGQKTPSAKQSK